MRPQDNPELVFDDYVDGYGLVTYRMNRSFFPGVTVNPMISIKHDRPGWDGSIQGSARMRCDLGATEEEIDHWLRRGSWPDTYWKETANHGNQTR